MSVRGTSGPSRAHVHTSALTQSWLQAPPMRGAQLVAGDSPPGSKEFGLCVPKT